MSAVGRGEMRAADVARAMYPDYKEERAATIAKEPKAESGWFGLKRAKSVKVKVPEAGSAIPIRGINTDLPVRFAPTGEPYLAIALWASSRQARGSPYIRSSHPR